MKVSRTQILFILFGLCVSMAAWALDSVVPVRYTVQKTVSGGATTSATWKVARSGAASTFVERTFTTSAASLGSVVKKALRGGVAGYFAYEAAKALVEGAGWAISELSKQVQSGGAPSEAIPPNGTYWICEVGGAGGIYGRTAGEEAIACGKKLADIYGWTLRYIERYGGSDSAQTWMVAYTSGGSNSGTVITISTRTNTTGADLMTTAVEGVEVSDEQLGQAALQNPEKLNEVLNSNGVVQMTPELLAEQNALKKALAEKDGQPEPTPDIMPTEAQQAEANKKPVEEEWPKFCTWASKVCEWIDWTKKPAPEVEDEPIADVPITADAPSWNSGLASGSCPSAVDTTLSIAGKGTQLSFSYTPLCDFVSFLRPLLLAAAGIICVYILSGLRQTGV